MKHVTVYFISKKIGKQTEVLVFLNRERTLFLKKKKNLDCDIHCLDFNFILHFLNYQTLIIHEKNDNVSKYSQEIQSLNACTKNLSNKIRILTTYLSSYLVVSFGLIKTIIYYGFSLALTQTVECTCYMCSLCIYSNV